MRVNKANKFGVHCGAAYAVDVVRVLSHAGIEVNNMLTEDEQSSNDAVALKQFTEKRQLLTRDLQVAMKEESVARENNNASLRGLRRAERRTKAAAEALGEHGQQKLGL